MKIQDPILTNGVHGKTADALAAIHHEENSIAVYERDIQSLNQELRWAVQAGCSFESEGDVGEISLSLEAYFQVHLPKCSGLLNDLIALVQLFAEVTKDNSYRVSLSTVSSNMCRKFHTDINDLRLLCTYIGQGTLWVSEDPENRIKDVEQPIDNRQIHQAKAGDVLILKGALHPNGNPVLHKSPAIENSGESRLLLRVDTSNKLEL